MSAEGDNNGFLFDGEDGGARAVWGQWAIREDSWD